MYYQIHYVSMDDLEWNFGQAPRTSSDLCSAGNGTQGLVKDRQALYQPSFIRSCGPLRQDVAIRVPGWPPIHSVSASGSEVTRPGWIKETANKTVVCLVFLGWKSWDTEFKSLFSHFVCSRELPVCTSNCRKVAFFLSVQSGRRLAMKDTRDHSLV